MDRTVEGVALLNIIEERIGALWKYRAWYRTHRWAEWPLRRVETDAELRALVRHLRTARRLARPVVERQDPVTAALAALAFGDHLAGLDDLPSSKAAAR